MVAAGVRRAESRRTRLDKLSMTTGENTAVDVRRTRRRAVWGHTAYPD